MKKKLICTMVGIVAMCMLAIVVYMGAEEETVKDTSSLEKIALNHIGVSADEYDIKKVNISQKITEQLPETVPVYKVQAKLYTDSDIKKLMKKSVNCNIVACEEEDNTKFYSLSNGGNVTYYENSGAISYTRNDETDETNGTVEGDVLSDEKLVKIAEQFIKQSQLYDLSEMSLYKVQPSMTVEDADNTSETQILEYEVIYTKIPPEGIDGFDGTGPGIIVSIDATGEVIGFVSIDKDIELVETEYPTKTESDIEADILNSNNVMIYSQDSIDENIKLNQVEYVLYCDSVGEEQEYMVPHYRFKNKKEKGLRVVLPAIDNSYITIKKPR